MRLVSLHVCQAGSDGCPMRIIVHEMGTYSQNQQLAKALASFGHKVGYAYCPSFQTPSRPSMCFSPGDGVTVLRVELDGGYTKRNLLKRFFQERAYGTKAGAVVAGFRPDLVISGNTPIEVQAVIQKICRRLGTPFLLWMQDIYSIGVKSVLSKAPVIGVLVAARYAILERDVARLSDRVVVICEEFRSLLADWDIDLSLVTVIENWGTVPTGPLPPKENEWAARHDLFGKRVLLYSGTLGFKHNPQIFLDLARKFRDYSDVRIVVISEGYAAEWLSLHGREFPGLVVLPFQGEEDFRKAMAAADILIAILEREAARFSVPSKILTYMCAGKPILAAISAENLAARTLAAASAGVVADPEDSQTFCELARQLIDDEERRLQLGAAALDYARVNFEINTIGRRFEYIFRDVVARQQGNEVETGERPSFASRK
jgi:glycosyltransferase involved in cell wall biosynthesis